MFSAVSDTTGVTPLPPCPHLPPCPDGLDWRFLNEVRAERDAEFYCRALIYGQYLWQRRFAARAILAVDRALGADLTGAEPILAEWPLPYPALVWMLRTVPEGLFIGNPRVHFQHLADRIGPPRRELRSTRYWACWCLTRRARPELEGDPRHPVREPAPDEVLERLARFGVPGEAEQVRSLLHRL